MTPVSSTTRSTEGSPTSEKRDARGKKVTPFASWRRRTSAPSSGPTARSSGVALCDTIETRQPRFAAVAAISQPMNPEPRMTTSAPGRSASRSATASSTVRRRWMPPRPCESIGSGFGRSPVAITSPSNACTAPVSSVTVRACGSSAVARRPSIHSTSPRLARRGKATSAWPCPSVESSSFDSGGRLYGACSSAPSTRMAPV